MHFSDVVVQIVDSRNPLLFRCEDLVSRVDDSMIVLLTFIQEAYVKEVCSRKENMLLLSKSDLLSPAQR